MRCDAVAFTTGRPFRTRDCYLAAQYRRLVKRRGDKNAIVAVAHSILVIAYHVLRDGLSYRELGGDYFDHRNADRLTRYWATRTTLHPRRELPRATERAPRRYTLTITVGPVGASGSADGSTVRKSCAIGAVYDSTGTTNCATTVPSRLAVN